MWYLAIDNEESGAFSDMNGDRVDLLEGQTIRRTVNGKIVKNRAAGAREYENRENAIRYMKLTPWEETAQEEEGDTADE